MRGCFGFGLGQPVRLCGGGFSFGGLNGGTQQPDPVFQRQGGRCGVFGGPVRSLGQPVLHQPVKLCAQHADIAALQIDLTGDKAGLSGHLCKINA